MEQSWVGRNVAQGKCEEDRKGVMSVETGSAHNGGQRSGLPGGLTLKLQKEGGGGGRVGKVGGLEGANRGSTLLGAPHCTTDI
jgi:hypothetical protein